jgi:DNA polymerase-3 subunit alpha
MDLNTWIEQNHLSITRINDYIIEIEEVGKFYILEPKENIIVDKELTFVLSDDDMDRVERLKPNFFLFQFGVRWYYSKLETFLNTKRQTKYKFSLNEFMYIGKTTIDNGSFFHLGIHSCYELMNGSRYAEDWCQKAKFINMSTIGICDKNTLAGTLDFQIYCDKKQIKPIIGETVSIRYDSINGNDLIHDVKFYVKNKKGWNNLLHINKIINVDNHDLQYIEEEILLSERYEGLVIVFTKDSHINQDYNNYNNLPKYLEKFDDVFYQIDSVEFESDEVDIRYLDSVKYYINNFSDTIRPILINDSYYINKEEYVVKNFINKVDGKVYPQANNQYFKTLDETIEILAPLFNEEKQYCNTKGFEIIIEAIENTKVLSDLCDFRIPIATSKMPRYEYDGDNEELFLKLIEEGFSKLNINPEQVDEYVARVEKEYKVIKEGELIDYFLINWDIINWAKTNDIFVGTGRGSVAGSLIAMLIGMTTVDPIRHNLLFERFLNETRTKPEEFIELEYKDGTKKLIRPTEKFDKKSVKSFKTVKLKRGDQLPDVDTDFESERRDEVKNYISERFGKDHVCHIGAYTTIKMKGGLKDFSRVKGLKFSHVNFVTGQIPQQLDYKWSDLTKFALQKEVIGNFMQTNHDICDLLNFTLEQPRAASIHASATVIVPKEDEEGNPMTIFDWMPIRKVKGVLVSEWSGSHVDKAGFLKEDILSLSQLDKFKMMIKMVKKNRGIDIVLEDLPLDDREVYKLFKKGLNEDVFQFTSGGLKSYSAKVKPDNFDEITAMTALYRPGPMKSNAHEDFADFKHGIKKPKTDPFMEVVTKDTFGLYIYQEQIMQAFVVAGMTLVESDQARTIIKKFLKEEMLKFQIKFVDGLMSKGLTKQVAEGMWDKIMAFSAYGFNKSHSVAYTLLSYWSQYFKVHYPLEFWTASLNFCHKAEEIPERLNEFKKLDLDISIVPPDINYSSKNFRNSMKNNSIYWSFSLIKGFASSSVDEIITVRAQVKKFNSMQHFLDSVKKSKVNKGKMINLIISGAFDRVENITSPEMRKELLSKYGEIIGEDILLTFEQRNINRDFYWIGLQRELTGYGDIDYKEIIKSRLKNIDKGIYLQYRAATDFFKPNQNWARVCVAGILQTVVEGSSKNGPYVRFAINSNNELINGNLWNEQYLTFPDIAKLKGKLVAISGVIKFDAWSNKNVLQTNDETKIIEL